MPDTLQTARLNLRPLTPEDLDLLAELNSDPEVMRYILGRASLQEEVEAEIAESLGARWLVFDRSGLFLGWVGAVPAQPEGSFDLGWRFLRRAWGQGFATEAAAALMEALFAEGAARLFAQTMAVNTPSRRVMERLGLSYVRTFHLHFEDPLPGTELGEVEYELTRDQWLSAAAGYPPSVGPT